MPRDNDIRIPQPSLIIRITPEKEVKGRWIIKATWWFRALQRRWVWLLRDSSAKGFLEEHSHSLPYQVNHGNVCNRQNYFRTKGDKTNQGICCEDFGLFLRLHENGVRNDH